MTPGAMLGSRLTPGTLLRDYFKEPLPRLKDLRGRAGSKDLSCYLVAQVALGMSW